MFPSSVQFSHSVMSNSLRPHGLQHSRPHCLSATPGVYSNSCPSSRWCHPTISSSVISSPPAFNLFQHQGLFQWVNSSHQWPKYWSFSFSISFLYDGLVGSPCSSRDSPESFPMSQLFTWGGQSTGISASASFLPKKSQGWSPSEWTGWISLRSMELSTVFSNTTVQKHQFFGTQLSSQSNSHIHTWPLEKP